MKIEDRKEFLAKLNALKPAVARAGIIPALSHIWFDKKNVYAYDGGLGIMMDCESDLDCGVPGLPLLDLLGTSNLSALTLNPAPDNHSVEVVLGRSKSLLHALTPDSSVWQFTNQRKGVKMEIGEEMIEGFRKCLLINPSKATRVEHHGIILEAKGKDTLRMYATDSKSLVRVELAQVVALKEAILLPRVFIKQLVDLCPGGAEVFVTGDCYIADGQGISIYSNMLDSASLMDLGKIVTESMKAHGDMVPIPAGLAAALNRAVILAGEDDAVVEIVIDGKAMKVSGNWSKGNGELADRLVLDEDFGQVKAKFDAEPISKALTYGEQFSIGEKTLAMTGGDDWLYITAAKS